MLQSLFHSHSGPHAYLERINLRPSVSIRVPFPSAFFACSAVSR